MKFLGVKNEIPEHIRRQAKAAKLRTPDFYVGPTVSKTPSMRSIPRKGEQGGRDPKLDAEKIRKDVLQAARDRRRERMHHAVQRLIDVPRMVFRRPPRRRPKAAR
jgi:hypothetical protein